MCVFCDRLKFGSTASRDCRTGQNKGRYRKQELLLLLFLLAMNYGLQNGFHPIVPRLPRPFPRPNRRKYSLSHVCVGSSTMANISKICPKIMRPLIVLQD